MNRTRVRRILGRLGTAGRLGLAVLLLGGLWLGTVRAVEDATSRADERRMRDWLVMAHRLASPVQRWLDAGAREASAAAAYGSPREAVDALMASPRRFTTSVMAIAPSGSVLAASGDLRRTVDRRPSPCTEGDIAAPDRRLEHAASARELRVSEVLLVPGECRTPTVAVTAPTGYGTLVALAPLSAGLVGLEPGALAEGARAGGTRLYLIDPALNAAVHGQPPATAADRLRRLLERAAGRPLVRRYPMASASSETVGAAVPVGSGWTVVLEQDAAVFDLSPSEQPTPLVGLVLVLTFAGVFIVVAFTDLRRRRAHRRAEEAKNAFFSVAGHELRTPLTSLKGFLETLAARWDDLDDDRRKMLLDRMLPAARRLYRLVDRLLVAASIQAETHIHPQVAPTRVEQVLQGVADEFRPEAPLHEFDVRVAPDLPEVQADPRALEQVLQHLVDNAVKYSPGGGVVRILAVRAPRGVAIAVEDEGVGLPSDTRRIFEALVQGEDVTKRVHDEGGMGVGLFIVRTLVGEMGGSVRAERRTPQGARFVVTLRTARTRTKTPVAAG